MAISLQAPTNLLPIQGVRIATAAAGIKYQNRDDLVLFEIAPSAITAVVLTNNQFCAAPVSVAREHLESSQPKFLLINSGNANAGLGKQGIKDAKDICVELASRVKCEVANILPFSTGVIGEGLPVEKIIEKIPSLIKNVKEDAWLDAANAIMTTDTVAKGFSEQLNLDGNNVSITGIAKGAGMICPNMATMLAYIATDLRVNEKDLNQLIGQAVDQSFHCITVDGDTSTNDACALVATGESGAEFSNLSELSRKKFIDSLESVFLRLAQAIIRDGEGVTKFISVKVEQALNHVMAREIAFSIAHSPLVKTAAFASDPNWGRILAAAGRGTNGELDFSRISLFINDIQVIKAGELAESYSEKLGQTEMQKDEIQFLIQLGKGESELTVWTTDLSYDYVKINAEYRT